MCVCNPKLIKLMLGTNEFNKIRLPVFEPAYEPADYAVHPPLNKYPTFLKKILTPCQIQCHFQCLCPCLNVDHV